MLIYWRLGSILTTTNYNTTTPINIKVGKRSMIYNLQVEKPTHLLLTCGHGIVREAWPSQWAWLKIGYPTIPWIVSIFPISRKTGYTIIYHGIHYFQTYPRILRNSSCVCKTRSLDENPTWHLTMLMPHLLA